MGFRRKVNDRIDVVFAQQPVHQRAIADGPLHHLMAIRIGKGFEIVERARVGQQI